MTSVKEPVNGQEGELTPEESADPSGKARAKEGMAGLAKGLAIIEAFGA
jgi:IclR family transcriptional regulator, pca regulon regulatory protein